MWIYRSAGLALFLSASCDASTSGSSPDFAPTNVIDLGAEVTEDINQRIAGKAFLSRGIRVYEQLFNVKSLLDKERMFFVGVPANIRDGNGMIVRPVVFVY